MLTNSLSMGCTRCASAVVFRAMRFGVIRMRPSGEMIDVDDIALDLLARAGIDADALCNSGANFFRVCGRLPLPEGWRENLLAKGVFTGSEVEIKNSRSESRWYSIDFTTSLDESVIEVALRDVTERKAEELALERALVQAKEADAAKGRFLATISHEVRTPLNGIIGMIDLAYDRHGQRGDQDYDGFLRTAKDSATNLLLLVNDVLDFSKLETGAARVEFKPFASREFLRSLSEEARAEVARRGLRWSVEIFTALPEMVIGDPLRLRQLLKILISNAAKFTRQGGVSLRVSTQAGEDGQSWTTFAVADTGVGIEPERLGEIFEPFVQLSDAMVGKDDGVGLGLAMARHLASLLGGRIEAKSSPGKGSEFRVTLPMRGVATPVPEERPTAENLALVETRAEGLNVLVVEDNPVNQKVACHILRKEGHRATVAVDGVEALERLAQEPFDLVLMDLQMPRMDGVTAARTWRAKECDSGSRVPIVAMTAYPQDRGEAQCFEAGMDGYLLKPVSRESLKAAIVSARERVLTMTVSPRTCVGASVWPFDQTEMLERIGEDMSLLRELSELYSQAWPALIEKMRRQLSQREREALRRTAHAIKGLVGNFAAKSAYERARGIEFGAASTAWEDLEKECNELEGRVKELDFSLKTYLEKEPSRPIL